MKFSEIQLKRKRRRSQALSEFALILPILITLICAAIDYSLMVYKMQTITMLARSGVNTAYRLYNVNAPQESIARAVSNVVLAAAPNRGGAFRNLMSIESNGAVVVTAMTSFAASPTTNSGDSTNYLFLLTPTNPTNSVQCAPGHFFGTFDAAANGSKLLAGTNWQDPRRTYGTRLTAQDVATNQVVFAVEIFFENEFITPAGFFLNIMAPASLYDIATF